MAALCNGRRGDRPNALLACVAMWWSGSDCDDDDDEDHSHEVGEALEISVSRTREKTHNTQQTHTLARETEMRVDVKVAKELSQTLVFFPSPCQARL